MADQFHETNRRRWDAGSASWARRADTRGIWKRCHVDPTLVRHSSELKWLEDVSGKSIAVLGSGDNQVVFALSGMGARVTSIDISQQQIDVARNRAAALGLNVTFVRADVVDLSCIGDATFDLVYTGGHVAVWVSNLQRYYGEAARILKPDGLLIVSEYHPFRRVWKPSPNTLEIGSNYFNRGPHRFDAAPDVLYPTPGELEQFQFHWTVADFISAMFTSGFRLIHAEEFGDTVDEWEGAPLAGLPLALLLVGRRIGRARSMRT
jgi:SAM-dependent methyltransferase